jgi:hypothetical protein
MWPSDHLSVECTFRVSPSPTPSFVAAEARAYEQGDEVSVRYHRLLRNGNYSLYVHARVDRGPRLHAGRCVRAARDRQALAACMLELVLTHPERHEPRDQGDEENAAEKRLDHGQRLGQTDRG